MSFHHLGETRSRRALDHLLQTPDAFVWAPLPGMAKAAACIHASPAMGARFLQYTARLEEGGALGAAAGSRFVYVLEGVLQMQAGKRAATMGAGGFCWVPEGVTHTIAAQSAALAVVIEKRYVPLRDVAAPELLVGGEMSIPPQPLNGDDAVQVRSLLQPGDMAFDFAVNTMTYEPGARLAQVEVHDFEHGLLMLEGEGIYRLGDSWYPVAKGDFIWMAPYCPQWFGALGKTPAKYLIYKNWNRNPLDEALAG